MDSCCLAAHAVFVEESVDLCKHAPRMFGHAHIVRHHHDSRALRIEFAEQLNDLLDGLGVEVARGFVGEQYLRRIHQRTCDGRSLLHAARQFRRPVAGEITEADAREQVACALQALAPREAAIDHGQCDVVGNRVAPEQIERLKHETEKAVTYLRQLGIRTTRDLAAFEQVVTGARHVETAEDIEQGRLARTRRSHERHVFTLTDRERDALEHLVTQRTGHEDLGHVFELDERRGHYFALDFCMDRARTPSLSSPLSSETMTASPAFSPLNTTKKTQKKQPVSTIRRTTSPSSST